jgi:dTDP-4-amino-4,6-dideoxygalactose transaminase
MDNLRAAILLPQLAALETSIERWNDRYRVIETTLAGVPGLRLPPRPRKERYVGSSIQFMLPGIGPREAERFVAANRSLGVELKWFGAPDPVAFTSSHHSWRYMQPQSMPRTDDVLAGLFDMRIPLTFSLDDCAHIADIIATCASDAELRGAA